MTEISIKELSDIVEKRLFSAGKMLLSDALAKLGLSATDSLTPEDAIFALEVMRESMHSDVSKDAVNKCIEDITSKYA